MCAYTYEEKLVLISDDLADDLVSPHDYPYLTVVPTGGTANHHPKPERAKVSVVGEPQFTWQHHQAACEKKSLWLAYGDVHILVHINHFNQIEPIYLTQAT